MSSIDRNGHDDPNVIRKQIEETRDRIADTAEALAYKTDVPARVKDNVADRVDAVKGALAEATTKVTQGVHDVSQSAKSNLGGAASTLDETKSTVSSKVEDAKSTVAAKLDDAKTTVAAKVDDTRAAVASKVSDTTSVVATKLADAKDDVSENIAGIGDAATEKLERSKRATKSAALSAKGLLEKNPLGLALGSIAAGFLIGLALPVSDLERDNVGPLGEKVKDQAKQAATEIVAQGKAVVATAVTDALSSNRS
ncbi:MAG: hypothetical protein NVS2B3_15340 [Vulcanimicrobiaceae bacterium]